MSKKIVLIADDSETILQLISIQLKTDGYKTILARDGKDAIEKVKDKKPDIILLDVMMPKLNGFEVAKIIKEDRELNNIPIIMVTAQAEFDSKETGIMSGADDYVTKPVDFKDLKLKIRALLRIKELNDKVRYQKQELEKQLSLAKKLQSKLLSFPLQEFDKIELYTKFISSDVLSGDLFFVKKIDKDRCFFIVADISCKGVESALIMLLFNSYLQYSIEKFGAANIEDIFFYLNNELLNMNIDNNFIATFCGLIDSKLNSLNYINAGLPHAFIFKSKNEFKLLKETASVLGAFFTAEFRSANLKIDKDDKFFVFTKGIINALNLSGDTFSTDELANFLKKHYNANLKFMFDNIYSSIITQKKEYEDDIVVFSFSLK